jgi:hypothetical protein
LGQILHGCFFKWFFLSLSLCLDIGIANIAMMTLAMQRGYAQGFCLGLGTCVGDLLYAIGALLGMSVLLQFTPVRWLLWIGGGAILLWFTFKMGREALQSHQQIDLNHSIYSSSASKSLPQRGCFGCVLTHSHFMVCNGGRCADFSLRSSRYVGCRVVSRRFFCGRLILGSGVMWCRKLWWESLGEKSAALFVYGFSRDFYLFFSVRDGFWVSRIFSDLNGVAVRNHGV